MNDIGLNAGWRIMHGNPDLYELGIPMQIKDGENDFLCKLDDLQGFADRIVDIFRDEKFAESLGKKVKVFFKNNFLITGLLPDYLSILNDFWGENTCFNFSKDF